MPGKKDNWFSRATLKAAMAERPEIMQSMGWQYDKSNRLYQGDWSEEGPTRLRESLSEIASAPLMDLGIGFAGEALMTIPKIRRAVSAIKVAKELNKAAKNVSVITESAGRNGKPILEGITNTDGVRLQDYLSTYRNLINAPSYSGYVQTAPSPNTIHFVEDVGEAVDWAMRRGDVKPAQNTLLQVYPKDYIGNGAESIVYGDPNNPERVLKIIKSSVDPGVGGAEMGFKTKEEAVEYAERALRTKNSRPYNLRENIVGVIENEYGNYSPVSSQKRVVAGSDYLNAHPDAPIDFFQRFGRRIGDNGSWAGRYVNVRPNEIIFENGFIEPRYNAFGEFEGFLGKDFKPANIGILEDGTQMGIDLRKNGGLLDRLNSHYGDKAKVLGAIRKARENVMAKGGYIPSDSIKDYIKKKEAFRDKWYKDGNGIDTVGYGFTGKEVKRLYPNGMTRQQADEYFDTLVGGFAKRMYRLTPNIDRLSQNQKDALFSYFYNIGEGNYTKGSPKMQQALRDFDLDAVMQNIDAGYNDKKNPGLRKRRDYERALFGRDIQYPLQPVIPARNTGVLYMPEIKGFNTTIPMMNGKMETVQPFLYDYASGGKIHIKPENRGKFTALKKRTGHSASWFKAHGTPAQKKMAVFALNARKWKHGDGGLIDRYGEDAVKAALQKLKK